MKYILLILSSVFFMIGCSKIKYIPLKQLEFHNVYFRDTIIKTVLVPFRDSVLTPDTFSYLKNKYAESKAVWSQGKLFHSLNILPDTIPISIEVQEIETIRQVEIPVEIEKKLTKWERIKMNFGGWAIAAFSSFVVFLLIYFSFKTTRKT